MEPTATRKETLHVGFTGTRQGCSPRQLMFLKTFLVALARERDFVLHHGDCVGADAEVHALVEQLEPALRARASVEIHPPLNTKLRAFCSSPSRLGMPGYSFVRPPLPYLKRNHALVDAADVVLAAPATAQEVLRSGTWATVRYARKRGKFVHVITP